jgi:hypothetical protein
MQRGEVQSEHPSLPRLPALQLCSIFGGLGHGLDYISNLLSSRDKKIKDVHFCFDVVKLQKCSIYQEADSGHMLAYGWHSDMNLPVPFSSTLLPAKTRPSPFRSKFPQYIL